MTFTEETALRWAQSVTDKELEANIVALQGQPPRPQPVSFRDGWVTVVTTTEIVSAAMFVRAQRA